MICQVRNAYMLIDFGNDFAAELNGTKVLNGVDNAAAAFIQLLSTSNDTAQLHAEFVKARLSGGSSSASKVLDASQIKQDVKSIGHKVEKGIIIGAVVGGVVLLSLIACCCFCLCRRRRSSSKDLSATIWPGSYTNYRGLDEPAPTATVDMHAGPYAPGGSTAYLPSQSGTAWDGKH